MKSILVVSNTYFQLITAIRLKETHWNREEVDIVISDQCKNSERVANNLKKMNLFRRVFWIKTKELCQDTRNVYLKIKRWKCVACGMSCPGITNHLYDEVVYYNADVFMYGIFSKLVKRNPSLICSRYEEGVLSYEDSKFLSKSCLNYANLIRNFFKKKILEKCTRNFYCFYPQLYSGKLKRIAIPQVEDHRKMGEKLRMIFDIKDEMLKIHEIYIFFSSTFDFEGGEPIGEFELVLKIIELVGKENLIVKLHPRDERKIYEENGIKVYKNSSIPWEAIQLNCDCSNKIFLTVNSGSILGANMMLKNAVESYFLYNCCNVEKNVEAACYMQKVKQFVIDSNAILHGIHVVESAEKLTEICKSEYEG